MSNETVSNPGNGGFIMNWNKPGTIEADSEKTGNEIESAFIMYPTQIFESTSGSVSIKMTYSTPWKLTGLALINHNLTETAAIQLLFYTDANFTTLADEKTIPYSQKNTYIIIDENVIGQYRYIELSISDSALATIRIGIIFPGSGFQFPHNFSWGYTEEFKVDKHVDTTDGAFHHETPTEKSEVPEYSKFKITFNSVDPGIHDLYKKLIRVGNKIFIKSFQEPECYYGIVPDKNLKAEKEKKGDKYSIEFWEHSLGGGVQ